MSNSDDGETPSTDETSSPLFETITAEAKPEPDDVNDQAFLSPGDNVNVKRRSVNFNQTPSSLSASQTIGGPADADAMHAKLCDDQKKKIESFYGLHPLGIGYSELFNEICKTPMPTVPEDERLISFLQRPPDGISEDDLFEASARLKFMKSNYAEICSILENDAREAEMQAKNRRASLEMNTRCDDFNFSYTPTPLTSHQEKIIDTATSETKLNDEQKQTIVHFIKNPGEITFQKAFETSIKSPHANIDPKIVCGHLDNLFSDPSAIQFGKHSKAVEKPVLSPGFFYADDMHDASYEENSTDSEQWSYSPLRGDYQEEATAECKWKILNTSFHGKSVVGKIATMNLPPALNFHIQLRRRGNKWLAVRILEVLQEIVWLAGANHLQETKCISLGIRYNEYFEEAKKKRYRKYPQNEKVALKGFLINCFVDDLSVGVNLLLDLANIFNQVDSRSNLSSLGIFIDCSAMEDDDMIEVRLNAAEQARKQMLNRPWRNFPSFLAKAAGIVCDRENGIPKMLVNSDFNYAYILWQAYNCRGPNDGNGGLASTRKAIMDAANSVLGTVKNVENPFDEASPVQMKQIYQKLIMMPDKTGDKIDPDNAVERPDFYSKNSKYGSGFASMSSVQPRRAPYGKGEGGGSRFAHDAAEGGGHLKLRITGGKGENGGKSSSGGKGGSGGKGQDRGRSASKGANFSARRSKTPEMRAGSLVSTKPEMVNHYKTELQSLGSNLANIVPKINALACEMDDLSTSSPKFQKKFEGGAFKHKIVNSKIVVDFPPLPVFDDPYEFFNFKRKPVGVCCPESLYVRYCVYADIFRFLKTGTLTVYGHAYRLKFDKDWEQKSKQLGIKFLAAGGGGSKSN